MDCRVLIDCKSDHCEHAHYEHPSAKNNCSRRQRKHYEASGEIGPIQGHAYQMATDTMRARIPPSTARNLRRRRFLSTSTQYRPSWVLCITPRLRPLSSRYALGISRLLSFLAELSSIAPSLIIFAIGPGGCLRIMRMIDTGIINMPNIPNPCCALPPKGITVSMCSLYSVER